MNFIEELENAPWPKFCREAAEQRKCEICTNPEHANSINTLTGAIRKPMFCHIDCDKREKSK